MVEACDMLLDEATQLSNERRLGRERERERGGFVAGDGSPGSRSSMTILPAKDAVCEGQEYPGPPLEAHHHSPNHLER